MSYDIPCDAKSRLVPCPVAEQRLHRLVRQHRGISQRHLPFPVEKITGLHIHSAASIDERRLRPFRIGDDGTAAKNLTSHEISVEGEPSVLQYDISIVRSEIPRSASRQQIPLESLVQTSIVVERITAGYHQLDCLLIFCITFRIFALCMETAERKELQTVELPQLRPSPRVTEASAAKANPSYEP